MNQQRINERISAHKVILISSEGDNKGEVIKTYALEMARNAGLDLVEVAPGPIPVCKIADYGKIRYEQQKKKKHQHAPAPKEIRIGYSTGEGDLQRQIKRAKEFLSEGHRVTFQMLVKGRERYISGGVAKDKFTTIVKQLNPASTPTDIQENARGYIVVLHAS
jgi:translation initiation factor IF-3